MDIIALECRSNLLLFESDPKIDDANLKGVV